jgi:hypothetical protein
MSPRLHLWLGALAAAGAVLSALLGLWVLVVAMLLFIVGQLALYKHARSDKPAA